MLKYRLSKKADVSPAFQYIFALIVGAIILIFFIKFAFKAESTGKEVIKAEVLHSLDASMQAFSVSVSSTDLLPSTPWPQLVDMKFGTGANCGKFTVTGQKFLVPIPRIVFGPEQMKARQLKAWTTSWYFPFRVTNIFYLVNDRSKYYLIFNANNQDFVKRISSTPPATAVFEMDHLPREFDVKYYDSEADAVAKLKINDMVKVNYFEEKNGVSNGLKGSSLVVSNYCMDEDEPGYKCSGTVTFYEGNKLTGASTFIGRELMFAAVMADSIGVYQCQYGRALDEMERMINVYTAKAQRLATKRQECEYDGKYNSIIGMLNNMKGKIQVLKTNPGDSDTALQLSNLADLINEFNDNDLGGYEECEVLF
ncbi:hypothetical protein FJZ53_03000 [Candidatus Woesearchaeota archaeon]|nr:hypothetical protein [Candidatus Woesearchaeota archaeon]